MFTLADLKSRGWSPGLLRSILGEPCRTRANPAYRSAAPMKLWSPDRVETAERDARFIEHKSKRAGMAERARAAADRRRNELLAAVENMPVSVTKIDPEALAKRAIRHWECGARWDEFRDGSGADKDTVDRWSVNYARHCLTNYDHALEDVAGKVGVHEAICAIRRKVYSAIAEAYPDLAWECSRQMDARQI
jgi:hypothetical protein